ncbi:MAG TPA: ferrous iron transport protein A [Candidatus Anaerostipes excrementavium]|uniref:Ferrous iron transport protein A n=1 Tax=Candidatus Anaerostipes excrementavium TaxID=2838463 RepID=A0A9D1WTX8_9FIRM|nr:FeoA family protein [uncultured Anaerostipes sp.]HIX67068.1 ferrous iron transport protein A [Candidatus Anaerostipes excrementavium]
MLPLTNVPQGTTQTIKWAFGLPEIMEKLEELKIRQGSKILVIQKDKDYMIIGNNGRRIVIENKIAQRIQV